MPICSIHPLPYRADPTDYFFRVQQAPGAVLLDAGRPTAERGRFDIISAWPEQLVQPEPRESGAAFLQRLRVLLGGLAPARLPAELDLPFTGGLIGYLSYEFNELAQASEIEGLASATVGLYDWALISDHQTQRCWLMCHAQVSQTRIDALLQRFSSAKSTSVAAVTAFSLLAPFSPSISEQVYHQALQRVQAYIAAGDCYQVNYTQRFRSQYQGDPWQAYSSLRDSCPTPFASFIRVNAEQAILSLSPERFIEVRQRQVESRPIKGTRARGHDAAEDQFQADELLASRKDRAENLMIVDLLRNDLGRYCATGSIRVPELFALESYPNVHHMVSSVTGTLAAQYDALDVLIGSFPGGSITGAPKRRAMQIISELEAEVRSIYCGSIFYLDCRGEMDSSITIRTLLANHGDISCWGGGGIVFDSNSQDEYQESIQKVRVLMNALERLHLSN